MIRIRAFVLAEIRGDMDEGKALFLLRAHFQGFGGE